MQRTQAKILDTEERAAVIDRAKSHLELEKQRISQLLSMLSDFSTQAALLAGCAISAVSGESLDSLDDEADGTFSRAVGGTIFMSSAAVAVATSLWVIFVSSHLSSLTRDSALRPKIIEARKILEAGVHDVRIMQWFALGSLLVSSTAMAWLNTTPLNGSIFTVVLGVGGWQAILKKDDITATFREECGEEWTTGDTTMNEMSRFTAVWRRSFLARWCGCAPQPRREMN
tara:strand:- start:174 stop:860 length:687 start_codon:yes stop_codon:yes gene_type:complete